MLRNTKTVQWMIVIGILAGMFAWVIFGILLYGGHWS